jgi:uncharacterized DUF497 family protein
LKNAWIKNKIFFIFRSVFLGVSLRLKTFEQAREIFNDPAGVILDNYDVEDALGMSAGLILLAVVFIEFEAPAAFVIRIISARKAVAYEENIYREAREGHSHQR